LPSSATAKEPADKVDIVVAGSIALDINCDYYPSSTTSSSHNISPQLETSNPASISQSLGGVGFNITTATHLLGASVRILTAVGSDIAGSTIKHILSERGIDTTGIITLAKATGKRTAHYVAVNDTKKDLVMGMADMSILESPTTLPYQSEPFDESWGTQLRRAKPNWLVVDANWDAQNLLAWISTAKAQGSKVSFEPVSAAKSQRLFAAPATAEENHSLKAFPAQSLDVASPNELELKFMHQAARENGYLETQQWWEVIDALGMHGGGIRPRLTALTSRELVESGVPQQAIQILPFIPTLLVKLGIRGVLVVRLLPMGDELLSSGGSNIICRAHEGNVHGVGGLYIKLLPPGRRLEGDELVSVNGAGDTFLGVVMAGLSKQDGPAFGGLERLIGVGQKGSRMTLQSVEAVSPDLGILKDEL
jgi:pseudouridylate synthase / pseudouridine kinase